MSDKIYLRMLGYTAAIVMHSANIVDMEKHIQVASKNPVIKEFVTLQFKFFTCWTFIFQIAYAAFGLSCDLLTLSNGRSERTKQLNSLRETLFSAILWPTTFLVFSIFWPIYLYDESLIFPSFSGEILSPTNNHVIHTFIVPVVLWEMTFLPRSPQSHIWNLLYLTIYKLIYLFVLFYTYATKGVWPYPFLKMFYGTLSFPLFMAIAALVLLFWYFIQFPLSRLVWGPERVTHRRKLKKRWNY